MAEPPTPTMTPGGRGYPPGTPGGWPVNFSTTSPTSRTSYRRNARSLSDPSHVGARNEVASFPIDVPMVLPAV